MVDHAEVATDFRAGLVVSRSFSTLFRNILPFGLLALVLTSPTYVYQIVTQSGDSFGQDVEPSAEPFIILIVNILLGYVVTASLVYGTIQDLRNQPVSLGDCFSNGLAMIFPVLGVAIVSYILTMLAAFALVVPGVIVATMLWVAIPVAIVERLGLNSLSRSAALTKGYRWRIFFLFIFIFVISLGVSIVLGAVAGVVMVVGADGSGALSTPGLTGLIAIQWVVSAFISALSAVLVAVSYRDLRVAKEGADTQQIASVFD